MIYNFHVRGQIMKKYLKVITLFVFYSICGIFFCSFKTSENEDSIVVDSSATPVAFNNNISSINFVKEMGYGVNLGNYFDTWCSLTDGTGVCLAWGQPITTQEMIKSLGTTGARTIRIPVTWFNHIIDDNYTIDPEWMKKVKQVVDWAYAEGYYVILNTHHDVRGNMSSPLKYHEGYILRNNKSDIEESERFLRAIWKQICTAFNNSYNEHLLFETMNEPRNSGHEHEWSPVTNNCTECKKDFEILNIYNQLCLDTIRESGGNNAKRFVLIPNAVDNYHLALENIDFKMPVDSPSANDKLILTLHHYPLYNHLWKSENWDLSLMEEEYSKLNSKYIEKGIPIVLGEIGPCGTDSIEKAIGRQLTEEEAYAPCSDLTKIAAKYGMSVLMFPREYGLGNLEFSKRMVNDYSKIRKEFYDKEIEIKNYYIKEGDGTYDKASKILKTTVQYADFSLPECIAKSKYICIEYTNLTGKIRMIARHDDGDNDYYSTNNPEDFIDLNSSKSKMYLKLNNMQISKKLKLEFISFTKTADVKILKIYFTDKKE